MTTNNQRPAFWRHLPAWLVFGLGWLVAHMPYRMSLALGRGIGWLFRQAFKSRRQVINRNISACFPALSEVEQQQLMQQNYRETGMMVTQTLRTFLRTHDPIVSSLKIKGSEHLQQAIDNQQGVLLVSGHFTALDVGGRALCENFQVAGVYRPHKNPVQEYVVKQARLRYAQAMFSRDELKGIVRHLKSAGVVWYAPDQNYRRGQSVFVDFFGVPAATITATHQLARMTGCQVMGFQVKRLNHSPYYEMEILSPLENFPSGDVEADTQRINRLVEQMVRQAPEQYLWLHKRFKTRPQGEAPFY